MLTMRRNSVGVFPEVVTDGDVMTARPTSPSSIYHIPEPNFTKRPAVDVKVRYVLW